MIILNNYNKHIRKNLIGPETLFLFLKSLHFKAVLNIFSLQKRVSK